MLTITTNPPIKTNPISPIYLTGPNPPVPNDSHTALKYNNKTYINDKTVNKTKRMPPIYLTHTTPPQYLMVQLSSEKMHLWTLFLLSSPRTLRPTRYVGPMKRGTQEEGSCARWLLLLVTGRQREGRVRDGDVGKSGKVLYCRC